MTQRHHHAGPGHDHDHESGLADLLDLDAEMLGSSLVELTAWVERIVPAPPRTVVDVGAGTGTGTLALARSFGTAEVVAIDRSALMLSRVRSAADEQGLGDRVRVVLADLDEAGPDVAGVDPGSIDVAWAASSLHEVAEPDGLLRDLYAALRPGGLLVVVELDGLPSFLPDDLGVGRPGLESRCHEALAKLGWNAHPDWTPHLEKAGFEIADRRTFGAEASPPQPGVGGYARAYLGRFRSALVGRLADDDLDTLDRLLDDGDPAALVRRPDLSVRVSRTAWAAVKR